MKGMPESVSAAEAPIIATMSGSFSRSCDSMVSDHLGLVAVAVGEQRADRPVDQAGDQRLVLGRAAFALEEAAGDPAGGVDLLLVVDGEREEVDAGLGLLHRHHGGEHRGLAIGGDDGAVGLAGDLAGLERQLAAGPDQLFTMDFEHSVCLHDLRPRESHEQDGERLCRGVGTPAHHSIRRSCRWLSSRVNFLAVPLPGTHTLRVPGRPAHAI